MVTETASFFRSYLSPCYLFCSMQLPCGQLHRQPVARFMCVCQVVACNRLQRIAILPLHRVVPHSVDWCI